MALLQKIGPIGYFAPQISVLVANFGVESWWTALAADGRGHC